GRATAGTAGRPATGHRPVSGRITASLSDNFRPFGLDQTRARVSLSGRLGAPPACASAAQARNTGAGPAGQRRAMGGSEPKGVRSPVLGRRWFLAGSGK